MKKETRHALDKQLKKDRNYLLYGVIALIIVINIFFITFLPSTTTTVSGTIVNVSSNSTDTSLSTTLSVQLDSNETVTVELPGEAFIDNQSRVQLTKSTTILGKTRYEFFAPEK